MADRIWVGFWLWRLIGRPALASAPQGSRDGSGLALLVVMHKQILALSGFEFRLHDHKLLTVLSFVNL